MKAQLLMLLTGLMALCAIALSLGWLMSGRKNILLRNMSLITLCLSLLMFFSTH
jgi:hypothetical protein